jgi:hypothetical protein
MTKPIQIRKDDVVRDVRKLASLRRRSITDVVGGAVRKELEIEERNATSEERARKIDRLLAEIDALPVLGPPLTDEDLYDEYGLPR